MDQHDSLNENTGSQTAGAGRSQQGPQTPPCCSRGPILWKVIAVLAVLAAAGIVVAVKHNQETSSETDQAQHVQADGPTQEDDSGEPIQTSNENTNDSKEKQKDTTGGSFPRDTVLATVNGTEITLGRLESALQQMSQRKKAAFKNRRHAFLDHFITRTLLLEKAESEDVTTDKESPSAAADPTPSAMKEQDRAINKLLEEKVLSDLEVTENEIKTFYGEHKDQMPAGRSFEELKSSLRRATLQEKRRQAVNDYLTKLQEEGDSSWKSYLSALWERDA